jgi:hypothetical protein
MLLCVERGSIFFGYLTAAKAGTGERIGIPSENSLREEKSALCWPQNLWHFSEAA